MDTMFNEPIVLLAAIILMPLVPAVLLYSLFKNHAEFRDVKRGIKLGGAVAFYFIVLIVAYPMLKSLYHDGRDKLHEAQIGTLTKQHEAEIGTLRKQYEAQIGTLNEQHEAQLETLKEQYEAPLRKLEAENADFAREIENTVQRTQDTITEMGNEYARKESMLKNGQAQELTELRTAFNSRVADLTSTFKEQLEEERSKLSALQARVAGLDLLRANLEGEWRWEATSSAPAIAAGVTPASAESLPGAPAAPGTKTSSGTATFQRNPGNGEILVVGTVDGQPGSFRASEIILDHARLTYIFEHQPSGTIGVSWLNFVKDGTSVKSMTGYWVLAGREGKGTLSFTRVEKQAAR